MSSYTLLRHVNQPYEECVAAVRSALQDQGFGVLTEIDLAATLKQKLGVDVPRQVILGACRPPLAYEAITAEPSIAAVLPCNVVVRAVDEQTTAVEAFDPQAMTGMADSANLQKVADDARQRLEAALSVLAGT